jgi:hypothetical protein
MYELIIEALSGLAKGLMSGIVAFFAVLLLAVVYRYFTNEKFPTILAIAVGLGFWGFTGGLLDIFDQPTFGGVFQILVVMIFVVWGVNNGDKIAAKIPKKSVDFLESMRLGKTHTTVKLPHARLIRDITGRPKVPETLKSELSDREFTFPVGLSVEELSNRVRRRLITDWGIGEAEFELDQDGKVLHVAIAAKEQGLSGMIPDGFFAVPIECKAMPSNLASGDFVKLFFENGEVIEEIQVRGLDKDQRVITIIADMGLISKINGSKASSVLGLPSTPQIHQLISVEHRSGSIEAFDAQKIKNSLKRIGVQEDIAVDIARKVQARISKLDPPVSTRLIKAVIVRQLEKDNPEAAEKLKSRRLWRF